MSSRLGNLQMHLCSTRRSLQMLHRYQLGSTNLIPDHRAMYPGRQSAAPWVLWEEITAGCSKCCDPEDWVFQGEPESGEVAKR